MNYTRTGLLHRLKCAFFNTYPFKKDRLVEATYRNGTYKSYLKEKLYDLQEYSKNIKKQPTIHSLASYITIASFLLAIIFYFIEPFKSKIETYDIVLPLIGISFGLFILYSFTILIIWNDKKNYSSYYEQLIEKNINSLELVIKNKDNQINELKNLLGLDFRNLFVLIRKLDFYTNVIHNSERIINLIKDYLNILCHITSKLNYEFIDDIDRNNIDKYSACIKLISKEDIISDIEFENITIQIFSRSDLPNHPIYDGRLKTMEKYDSKKDYISLNKDFSDLIKHKNLWHYYIDDLDQRIKNDEYYSSHQESYKFYQSGVAFPIIYRNKEEKGFLIGFLCFQNFGKNAFPSLAYVNKTKNRISHSWEEFCYSQVDILSIVLSNFLGIEANEKINKLLIRKRFRSSDLSNLT